MAIKSNVNFQSKLSKNIFMSITIPIIIIIFSEWFFFGDMWFKSDNHKK